MSWDREFDEPVAVPGGKKLRTLRDAANYALSLPPKERAHPAWQAAVSALIVNAEHGGATMFSRGGVMKALHRDMPPAAQSERKDRPWGRRPLKRDRL